MIPQSWRDLPTKTIYKLTIPFDRGFVYSDEVRDWLVTHVGAEAEGVEVFSRAFESERTRLWSCYKTVDPETFEPRIVFRFTDFSDYLFFKMRWY